MDSVVSPGGHRAGPHPHGGGSGGQGLSHGQRNPFVVDKGPAGGVLPARHHRGRGVPPPRRHEHSPAGGPAGVFLFPFGEALGASGRDESKLERENWITQGTEEGSPFTQQMATVTKNDSVQ